MFSCLLPKTGWCDLSPWPAKRQQSVHFRARTRSPAQPRPQPPPPPRPLPASPLPQPPKPHAPLHSASDTAIFRAAGQQLAFAAVKHHNLALRERKAVDQAAEHLQTAQALAEDIAAAVATKPSSTQDPTLLPVLDLDLWTGSLSPGEGWCLHPLFDRLLRRDVRPGPPDPLCSLLPADFMQIPIKVHCFSQALEVAAVPLCRPSALACIAPPPPPPLELVSFTLVALGAARAAEAHGVAARHRGAPVLAAWPIWP